MTDYLTYPELVREILRLSAEDKSGTVFIMAAGGHLVRFILKDGKIKQVLFDSGYQGKKAMELFRSVAGGRLQFSEGVFDSGRSEGDAPDVLQQHLEAATGIGTSPATLLAGAYPTWEVRASITKALVDYIGPFAEFVCDEYEEEYGTLKSKEDALNMTNALAEEIEEEDQRQAFLQQMRESLA